MIRPNLLMSAQEAVASAFVGEGITVRWDATVPFADMDNNVVHLRPMPEQVSDEELVEIRADCDHELAHFLYTDPNALRSIDSEMVRLITNAIDDGHIERKHGAQFLGVRDNLEASNSRHIEDMRKGATRSETSLRARTLTAMMLLSYGRSLPEVYELLGNDIHDYIDQVSDILPSPERVDSTWDAVDIATQIADRWSWADGKSESESVDLPGDTGENPAGVGNRPDFDNETRAAEHLKSQMIGATRKQTIAEMDFGAAPRAYRARTDDDVTGLVPDPAMFNNVEGIHPEFMAEVRQVAGPLRRRLLMEFRGPGLVEHRHRRRGKVDDRSLHKVALGDFKVFKAPSRDVIINRDITLMVDCSGSMLNRDGSYENLTSRKQTRLWTAAQAACACSLVLDLIGVTHEVLAWTTTGYAAPDPNYERVTPLYHMVVKHHTNSFHAAQRNFTRLGLLECVSDNIDGEAVLWGARRLATRARRAGREPLLIVFSDGQPQSGYESAEVLSWHLRNSVERIEAAGIPTLGIGIQADDVSHYYSRWAEVRDLSDLTSSFYTLLRDELRNSKKVV